MKRNYFNCSSSYAIDVKIDEDDAKVTAALKTVKDFDIHAQDVKLEEICSVVTWDSCDRCWRSISGETREWMGQWLNGMVAINYGPAYKHPDYSQPIALVRPSTTRVASPATNFKLVPISKIASEN